MWSKWLVDVNPRRYGWFWPIPKAFAILEAKDMGLSGSLSGAVWRQRHPITMSDHIIETLWFKRIRSYVLSFFVQHVLSYLAEVQPASSLFVTMIRLSIDPYRSCWIIMIPVFISHLKQQAGQAWSTHALLLGVRQLAQDGKKHGYRYRTSIKNCNETGSSFRTL